MNVVWTQSAQHDREAIWDYLIEINPQAAIKMDDLFEQAVAHLAAQPMMGKVGLLPNTREWLPHSNYRLVYQIMDDTIYILMLIHCARQFPPVK